MINSNELRIGNLVYSKYFKEIRIVGLVGNGNVLSYEIDKGGLDGTSGIADAEPIPLTEEWLVKLGAIDRNKEERDKYNFKEINWYFGFTEAYGDFRIYQMPYFKFYLTEYKTIEIKYVHQLQNLYFALTGEELVCK